MLRTPTVVGASTLLLALASGCGNSPDAPPSPGVGVTDVRVLAPADGGGNAVVVAFASARSGRARVSARPVADSEDGSTLTPWQAVAPGENRVLVLELLPETDYTIDLRLEFEAGSLSDLSEHSESLAHRTAALPPFLRDSVAFTTFGTASEGFALTGFVTRDDKRDYTVAIDGQGRVRWHARVEGRGAFVGQLANGNVGVFVGDTSGFQATFGYYIELSPGGGVVARHQAPFPFYTDNHELVLSATAAGGGFASHLFSYDRRVVDLTVVGGPRAALIAGHQLVRYAPDGSVDFFFNAWDHFELEDWVEEPASARVAGQGDFDHPNSLDIAADGNYLVSWRNFAQVTKIDSRSGEVLWRLGGRRNEFTIEDDPLGAFYGQHSARLLANGNLLLFDNGNRHDPQVSRAVEYELDEARRVARMVWEFRHDPPLYTPFVGSAQRLANGNTLVTFGLAGVAAEVNPRRRAVWEVLCIADGQLQVVYRMHKVRSLYGHSPG